jgi:hypothetical protein
MRLGSYPKGGTLLLFGKALSFLTDIRLTMYLARKLIYLQ